MLEDSFGLYGLLTITNIDNPSEKIEIIHRTGISAENKMMNKTQQYGSVSTYSHRYLLQHTFGIVDNELDPDNEKFYDKNNQNPSPSQNNNNNNGNGYITEAQVKLFWGRASQHGYSKDEIQTALNARNLKSVNEILKSDFNDWLDRMAKNAKTTASKQ